MRKREIMVLILLPVSQCLLLSDYVNGAEITPVVWMGILLNLIADMFLLYLFLWGFRKKKLERELEEFRYLQEAEFQRNEALEHSRTDFIAMRDDLNRRLEEVHAELLSGSTGEAEKNMNDIQKTLDGTRTREYCMNPVINAILAEKERVCQSHKIATEFELLVPRTLRIDALHLCSIFSNLLDNAIEAVSELPEEKRRITLKAELKNTYLVVRTDNPSTREHAERRIRKDHGYGTRILDSLAQKYEGSYSGHYGDGVYRAIVAVKVG